MFPTQTFRSRGGRKRSASADTSSRAASSDDQSSSDSSSTGGTGGGGGSDDDEFPLAACLADPKLAAEFVTTVRSPEDAVLLTLLYAIQEFEALVDHAPLSVQIAAASNLLDKFLVGPGVASVVRGLKGLRPSIGVDLQHTLQQQHALAHQPLPKTFFSDVYACLYADLRRAYGQFRGTREYAQLLDQQQRNALGGGEVRATRMLTLDQVLDDEWNASVFWVYLYRTHHHQRLSVYLEIRFRLDRARAFDRVCSNATATLDDDHHVMVEYRALVQQLKAIARKFLQRNAPVSVGEHPPPCSISMLVW